MLLLWVCCSFALKSRELKLLRRSFWAASKLRLWNWVSHYSSWIFEGSLLDSNVLTRRNQAGKGFLHPHQCFPPEYSSLFRGSSWACLFQKTSDRVKGMFFSWLFLLVLECVIWSHREQIRVFYQGKTVCEFRSFWPVIRNKNILIEARFKAFICYVKTLA